MKCCQDGATLRIIPELVQRDIGRGIPYLQRAVVPTVVLSVHRDFPHFGISGQKIIGSSHCSQPYLLAETEFACDAALQLLDNTYQPILLARSFPEEVLDLRTQAQLIFPFQYRFDFRRSQISRISNFLSNREM